MKYDIVQEESINYPECMEEFINYLSTIKGKSQNTIEAYKIDLTMFFRYLKLYKGLVPKDIEFEDILIRDIDTEFLKRIKLSDMYSFLSFTEKYRLNGTYARARKVATLRSFFKYLTGKAKTLTENPCVHLETPKINKRHPVYLTLNESRELLSSMDKTDANYTRDYCILVIFLNCGLRLSELCNINLENIREDMLTVIGKGNKERTVYLNKMCLDAIHKYMLSRNKIKHLIKEEDKNALFISKKKNRINKRSVERMVKKYVYMANLDRVKYTPHKLRHTAATLLYKHGKVDIRSLQSLLGHESVSTTQIYTHVDDENLREAVKLNPLNQE